LRKPFLILTLLAASILLAACASNSDAPAQAVQNYLNALVNKEADKLPTLVCADWENDAMIELDSFQAVTARLDNISCSQTGTDGDTSLVLCTGNIVATYGDEDQEIDLSTRTYQVVNQGGDWLVCGTR
jgi:outer membrane lipoprotein-sorting protein